MSGSACRRGDGAAAAARGGGVMPCSYGAPARIRLLSRAHLASSDASASSWTRMDRVRAATSHAPVPPRRQAPRHASTAHVPARQIGAACSSRERRPRRRELPSEVLLRPPGTSSETEARAAASAASAATRVTSAASKHSKSNAAAHTSSTSANTPPSARATRLTGRAVVGAALPTPSAVLSSAVLIISASVVASVIATSAAAINLSAKLPVASLPTPPSMPPPRPPPMPPLPPPPPLHARATLIQSTKAGLGRT